MNYKTIADKELVILHKSFFHNIHENIEGFSFLLSIPQSYKIVIFELGESIECSCFNYFIFYQLLKKHNIKNKIFVFTETENQKYFEWIKAFEWTPVLIYGFISHCDEHFNPENPMIVSHIPYWMWIKIPTKKEIVFDKKFLTLNNSFKNGMHEHRLDLYNFLKDENLLKDTYASFRFISEFDNNFGENIIDLNDIHYNNKYHNQEQIKELYDKSFLFIITESRTFEHKINLIKESNPFEELIFESDYFTEKTSRVLAMNMPFVIIGPYGLLKRLHKMGFKTFSEFWDESYDDIKNYKERFKKIKEIIKWVASKNMDELVDIYNKMLPIFEHNKKQLLEIEKFNKETMLKHIPNIFN